MKTKLLPVLFAGLVAVAGCDKAPEQPASDAGATATPEKSAAAPQKAGDEAAIAVIETDSYVMKVHRAIPFMPGQDPLGMLKVKEGHRYVVLDMSVKNKSNEPLEMGSIMLVTKISDESGKSYGGNIGALTAYLLQNPDPRHDDEYEAVWSMEFKPGEYHRAIALGVEVPADIKTFVLTAPVKPHDVSNTKQASFTIS